MVSGVDAVSAHDLDSLPADESRESGVAGEVGVSIVSSSGAALPHAGQKRLFGVRAAWQAGQVRGIKGVGRSHTNRKK